MPVIKVNEDEISEGAFETKRDKIASEPIEEDTLETLTDDTVIEEPIIEEPQAEIQAREKGWKPKEEFEGPEEEWIPAEEFVARGPLYETIHKLNRKIKKMEQTLDAASQQYSKVEKRVREETIASLKAELKTASDNNDVATALEVKDKIVAAEKDIQPTSSTATNPAFNTWVEDNQWYNEDKILRVTADGLGASILKDNPSIPASELYDEVSKIIKKEFPHKFKQESKVTTVSTTTNRTATRQATKGKKNLPSYNQLPPDAKINYRRLVKNDKTKSGIISHEQFMKDYVASGGPLEQDE